jgi:V8-like Glu-specific endopeptidase
MLQHSNLLKGMLCLAVAPFVAGVGLQAQIQAQNVIRNANGITSLKLAPYTGNADFIHARPMPLPAAAVNEDAIRGLQESLNMPHYLAGASAVVAGNAGTGSRTMFTPRFLGKPVLDEADVREPSPVRSGALGTGIVHPEDVGTSNLPFTTVRADLYNVTTNTSYPYRATGKLFFDVTANGYSWCTASMIKPGVVVTAAHCVAEFGKKAFHSGWQFVPGYSGGYAPYGTWTVAQAYVLTSYYAGTDSCAQSGVVCANDVAVLVLNTQKNTYVGNTVGWFGYWYGGGFTSNGLAQITQLGYPGGLDSALYMERTDSQAYFSSSNSSNHILGSNQNGGSSGGPWVENLGLTSTLTGETNGSFPATNVIVGVTSWGSTSLAPKNQGASSFTSGNIQTLLNVACGAFPGAC